MTLSSDEMIEEISKLVDKGMNTFDAWELVVGKYNLCKKEAQLLWEDYEEAMWDT